MDQLTREYKTLVRKAWQLFYLSHRSWNTPITEAGLSISNFPVLETIVQRPGITQQEITDEIRMDKSCTSRACKFLEANGFIRREKSTNCTHGFLCYPTEKALLAVEQVISRECGHIHTLFEQEDPAEIERSIELLSHLASLLSSSMHSDSAHE